MDGESGDAGFINLPDQPAVRGIFRAEDLESFERGAVKNGVIRLQVAGEQSRRLRGARRAERDDEPGIQWPPGRLPRSYNGQCGGAFEGGNRTRCLGLQLPEEPIVTVGSDAFEVGESLYRCLIRILSEIRGAEDRQGGQRDTHSAVEK